MEKLKVNMNAACRHGLRYAVSCALILPLIFAMPLEDSFAAEKTSARPVIRKAIVCKNNQVKLQWNRMEKAVKYQVYRKKAGGKFVLVKTTKKRTYQSRRLAYGDRYTYKIKAVFRNGSSRMSKGKVIYTKPAKPVISVAVCDGACTNVAWKKAKGAVRYKVYRKREGGRFVLVKTTDQNTYRSGELAYETRYTYKVKAVSGNGNVNVSKSKSVTTGKNPVLPDAPIMPDTSVLPDMPVISDGPTMPSVSEPPDQPPTADVPAVQVPPAERTVTIKVPIYETDTVYWIKDISTGEVLYKTADADAIEREILTRPNPETWHWGAGGVRLITGYEVFIMKESEWKVSWYHGQPDVIAEYHTETWSESKTI